MRQLRRLLRNFWAQLLISILLSATAYSQVQIIGNQLTVNGQVQPQLFGGELQYFRLRGGHGKNIPRAQVIALWNKALDHMVEAKMNSISFYIPWDFHEYAEGKFDFTGSADEDGDGNPDYPSRDLVTFFKQWQSLYNHDYGPRTLHRYQLFLQNKFGDLAIYNQTHFRNWIHWSLIQAPPIPGTNIFEDQDWYEFADESITSYLSDIRNIWQKIGVSEPQVLFTLAESYNSVPNGLLPNFKNRNEPGTTGLLTTDGFEFDLPPSGSTVFLVEGI